MRIALFGASGMIGQRILKEAVRRGHQVTAIARDKSKISAQDSKANALRGDILDVNQVAALAAGHDLVISAFGPSGGQAPEMLIKAARSLILGLKQSGVKRLIVVGGAGSLEVAPGVQLVDTPEFPADWKPYALAHREALNLLRAEGAALDWSYLSPAALIEPGQRTGSFRLGSDQLVTDTKGESRISAEDYAAALMDEAEEPKHKQQRFTAAY